MLLNSKIPSPRAPMRTNTIAVSALIGASLAALAAQAAAGDEKKQAAAEMARAYSNVEILAIKDFIGRVEVVTDADNSDLALIMTQGGRPYHVKLKQDGQTLVLRGEDDGMIDNIFKRRFSWGNTGKNALTEFLEDYPTLKISAPAKMALAFDDSVSHVTAGDGLGALSIDDGHVEATVGDLLSANVEISSSANVSLGRVTEALALKIGGSGDFYAVSASEANIKIGGSGDAALDAVGGDLSVAIGGSGDVETGDIGGSLNVAIAGSGDVHAGVVGGAFKVRIAGSGDVSAKSATAASFSIAGSGDIGLEKITGPADAAINGSGNIHITDGVAENLKVSIAGNGDFTFGGKSTNLDARLAGNGTIDVKQNTGALKTRASGGNIRVNGERIKTEE